MPRKKSLPSVDRDAFLQSGNDELFPLLGHAIRTYAEDNPDEGVLEEHLVLYTWSGLITDVPNGGFTQFFYNSQGDAGVKSLCGLLRILELPELVTLLAEAAAVYQKHRTRFAVDNPWDGLFGGIK